MIIESHFCLNNSVFIPNGTNRPFLVMEVLVLQYTFDHRCQRISSQPLFEHRFQRISSEPFAIAEEGRGRERERELKFQ